MLMLPVHIPTKSYAELMKGIRERAKGYKNPNLFKGMRLSRDIDGLIDVNESEHKNYMKVLTRHRRMKNF